MFMFFWDPTQPLVLTQPLTVLLFCHPGWNKCICITFTNASSLFFAQTLTCPKNLAQWGTGTVWLPEVPLWSGQALQLLQLAMVRHEAFKHRWEQRKTLPNIAEGAARCFAGVVWPNSSWLGFQGRGKGLAHLIAHHGHWQAWELVAKLARKTVQNTIHAEHCDEMLPATFIQSIHSVTAWWYDNGIKWCDYGVCSVHTRMVILLFVHACSIK